MSKIMTKNEFDTRLAVIHDELVALGDDTPDELKETVQPYINSSTAVIVALSDVVKPENFNG